MHNLHVKLFPFKKNDVALFPIIHAYSQERIIFLCSTKADFRSIQVSLSEFPLLSDYTAKYYPQMMSVHEPAANPLDPNGYHTYLLPI
jgi:hypothetical protein